VELELIEAKIIEVEVIDDPKPEPQRKGRAPMPSWDEIVFGSKSED
jgi:hypothetical protein